MVRIAILPPADARHVRQILPLSLPPRGLSRVQAAAYVGISPTKFDQLVADGRMPGPKKIDGRYIWDIRRVDIAFDMLPERDTHEEEDTWADLDKD